MTSNGRVARLTALALATGTLVAAGSTAATAASSDDVFTAGNVSAARTVLGGAGNGVIRLELNLPAEIPGLLPKHIVQDIVVTKSNTRSGATPDAIASAVLGENGNVEILNSILSAGETATLSGTKRNDPTSGLAPLLGSLGLLKFESKVANPNTVGTVAHSVSSIADLNLGDASVLNSILGPLQANINAVLGTLQLAPTSASSSPTAAVAPTVTNVVNTLVGTLNAATNDAAAPVTEPVKQAVAQVTTLLDGLLAQLGSTLDVKKALGVDGALIHVGLIKSEETVTRAANGTVTSVNDNRLADVSLLGGLVKASALTSTAKAALDKTGKPVDLGPAATSGELVSLNVADLLVAKVTDQIQVLLQGTLGTAIPADALAAVNGLLANITALTEDILGFSFKKGAADTSISKQDQSEQSAAAAVLTLAPPVLTSLTGGPLLRASFVPATASVVRAEGVTPVAVVNAPQTVTSLPRTGANLPLTGAAATALIGLALVARRRRTAHFGA